MIGGPGSGKSGIALSLLGELSRQGEDRLEVPVPLRERAQRAWSEPEPVQAPPLPRAQALLRALVDQQAVP